jgi:acetyl-CoA carboxylase, biotin carboxylase subunit
MKPFKKVLIANRGEIALRIIRTLKEMGIASVAVHSEADRNSMHVLHADEAVCIGPAPSSLSYLNIKAIISAAKMTKTDAIHPGYGFLAENAEFSKAVDSAGMVFIGPKPKAIQRLGYKSTAREIAIKAKVPIIPGTKCCVKKKHLKVAKEIGFPLMIKAAAGGGGKGMRVAMHEQEFEHLLHLAQSEAKNAFGDDSVYFEKFMARPRHVEIQFAADSKGNVVAFPERDCSIQRRHQKLIEESPCPSVTPKIREGLAQAAIRMVKSSHYTGVGTVEFLLDRDGNFYFMEVNTRLQVEHPVTEAVSGVDLVKEQILIAQGEKLTIDQSQALEVNGHSIECRINAEDPAMNFAPSPGKITEWITPGGLGVRLDTHVYQGYTIPSYYDSLVAKLIVWGPDRETAIKRALRALGEFEVSEIKTTISFQKQIISMPEFAEGQTDIHFLQRMAEKNKI